MIRPEVCRECPWRECSPPGELGDNEPKAFAQIAIASTVACHLSHRQDLPPEQWRDAEAAALRCHGAAVARGDLPVEPGIMSADEFVAHHTAPGNGESWKRKYTRKRLSETGGQS